MILVTGATGFVGNHVARALKKRGQGVRLLVRKTSNLSFLKDLEPFETAEGDRYWQAGLTVVDRLFEEPYLSSDPTHQGLILHSVYHRPNGWDHIPPGAKVPLGESSQWGDYHAREVALYLQRIIKGGKYYTFYGA